jgi:hypothetical protein
MSIISRRKRNATKTQKRKEVREKAANADKEAAVRYAYAQNNAVFWESYEVAKAGCIPGRDELLVAAAGSDETQVVIKQLVKAHRS